jgi:TetR/AcrR family transcriptional regulator, lmrAB and yxaGH operons repressor
MEVRDRMIEGTVQLLATRGLQATSFTEVLELTDSPRGSIYHHFPEGKEELVSAALERASERALAVLRPGDPATPATIAKRFIGMWRALLLGTDFATGCSIAAVTIAADTPGLSDVTGRIFADWRRDLARLLRETGVGRRDAERFSATLIAACEGAVILSRAEQSIVPFDLVANFLLDHLPSVQTR